MPKAGTSAFSYEELQEYWETTIAPLFGHGQLVKQNLIGLAGSGIVPELNAILANGEATRRRDFRGSRVADTEHGMLVDDMRSHDTTDLVLEFKPKWLSQSPAAPRNATRCRNCARQAYRGNKNCETLGSGGRRPLCPLKLIHCRHMPCSHDRDESPACEICTIVHSLLSGSVDRAGHSIIVPYKAQLSRWIRSNELLPLLQNLQVARETGLQSDQELNMTLRDCTCFLRIPADSTQPAEARLGDLDRKNGAAKRAYWDEIERRLVDGGYYEGKEVPHQTTACWLERNREARETSGEQSVPLLSLRIPRV